ncbi:MAG: TRASH domain-containing protein [Candidatus Hodarchaeales archaeon]|jgi:hypothetical protein
MIENIWILTKNGILLYSEDYIKLETETDLLAGFLSAIDSFVMQTTHQEIKSIIMEEKKFSYLVSREKNLMIVINSNLSDNNTLIQNILIKIESKFIDQYEKYLTNFSGITSVYKDFDPILEKIVLDSKIFATCDTCEKIIIENLIIKEIENKLLYFCCSSCEKEFKYEARFGSEIRSKLESKLLFCPVCKIKQDLPLHCDKPTHLEVINGKDKLVCFMGVDCGVLDIPKHCNAPMEIY